MLLPNLTEPPLALAQPPFPLRSDLHGKFVLKVCEFINALGIAHK